MGIVWGEKRPGSDVTLVEDEAMLVIGEPDWIRLPPELGGEARRVQRIFEGPCPVRGQAVAVKTYDLGDGLFAAESLDQAGMPAIFWYRRAADA